jgi:hypothetical protein
MATKLRSTLEKIHWPLLGKSLFVAFLWLFAPYWAFFLAALYFYFRPYFQPKKVAFSFFVLLALVFLAPPFHGAFAYAVAFLIGAVFYLLLGVKDLLVINRQLAYQTLRLALLLGMLLLFFWWGQSSSLGFVWQLLALFVGFFLLYYEYFSFVFEGRGSYAPAASLVALILFELAWALAWLPMGFLNASAVMLLVIFMLNDFVLHHFKRNLTRRIILVNFTVFAFSLLAIFLFSDWTI